jgi:quercetin dioxygenase-like cupin family protein
MSSKPSTVKALSLTAAVIASSTVAFTGMTSLAQEQDFRGQKIVQVLQEPRHRTVHKDGDIYLLDVQVNPGDTSYLHTHDAAILYTFISNGDGPLYGRVSGNTDYAEENFTHQVSNPGPGLFRIMALTNYGNGVEMDNDQPQGVGSPADVENKWFRSYRIELAPGEESSIQSHQNPSVIIQTRQGKVYVSREDGITVELSAMGDWAWRDANSAFKLTNPGNASVEVVINEARR